MSTRSKILRTLGASLLIGGAALHVYMIIQIDRYRDVMMIWDGEPDLTIWSFEFERLIWGFTASVCLFAVGMIIVIAELWTANSSRSA